MHTETHIHKPSEEFKLLLQWLVTWCRRTKRRKRRLAGAGSVRTMEMHEWCMKPAHGSRNFLLQALCQQGMKQKCFTPGPLALGNEAEMFYSTALWHQGMKQKCFTPGPFGTREWSRNVLLQGLWHQGMKQKCFTPGPLAAGNEAEMFYSRPFGTREWSRNVLLQGPLARSRNVLLQALWHQGMKQKCFTPGLFGTKQKCFTPAPLAPGNARWELFWH